VTVARTQAAPARIAAAALAIITALVFWRHLPGSFISYDDGEYVVSNAEVGRGLDPGSIAWAFTTTRAANWHPVTWLSHMLDVQLFGLDARKHHATSLLLHAANAGLLLLVLFRLTGTLGPSALTAGLFALHPLHVESFSWVAERKDVLSTFFGLLTLAVWLRYVRSKSPGALAAVLALYALSLMSKSMLVTLPFVLVLLDIWPLRRIDVAGPGRWGELRSSLAEKAPLLPLSAASCVMTWIAQSRGGTMAPLPFTERLANAVTSYVGYLGRMVWPSSLCIFYPHRHPGLLTVSTAGAAVVIAGISVVALRSIRTHPWLGIGWLWYLVTLVPVIGLVQVGGQAMADRYTYVPLVGVFVAIVWECAAHLPATRPARVAAAALSVAVLVALAVVARAQQRTWSDTETLFRHALAVTSDNWLAHGNLGIILLNQGKTAEAEEHLTEAIRIFPHYAGAHYNLALARAREGRSAEAAAGFRRALAIDPRMSQAHNNLAALLAGEGRIDEALAELDAALAIDPSSENAWFNLGNILSSAGRQDEAVARFRAGLELHPESAKLHNGLGLALARSGRMAEALAEFETAARLDPGFAEARTNMEKARAALSSSRP